VSNYELVYIISPNTTEADIPKISGKVSEYITKVGGSVTEVVQWGKKKLAYPIGKFGEGNYILTRVEIEPAVVKEFETSLKLSSDIIRHLLIRSNA
jgi:small subunit ribosomal protein S6